MFLSKGTSKSNEHIVNKPIFFEMKKMKGIQKMYVADNLYPKINRFLNYESFQAFNFGADLFGKCMTYNYVKYSLELFRGNTQFLRETGKIKIY